MRRHTSAAVFTVLAFFATSEVVAQSVSQGGRSGNGMVSAAQPLATEAGIRMLEMGGNAADAAIASAFAIAVVEPTMNSIAGRVQIMIRTPNDEYFGIDGTTQAPWDYDPATAPQASYGYAVIGVPGAVAGLMKLHEEHGSLPLDVLMEPAIEYAANGFRVLPNEAGRQAAGADQALEFPGTAQTYYRPDGTPYRAGELLRQPDYARTLRTIQAGGRDAFYTGPIADAMVADFEANGSVLTAQALADYEAEDARIVRGSYRGYDLIGMGIPAAGALTIQALQIMEQFDPNSMSEAEWFAIVGQALGIASPELRVLGSDTAAARATSKEWAVQQARMVAAPGRPATAGSGNGYDGADFQGHTTHLSTADADGMFVSLTQTLGPNMGSKVVTPGLGFLHASTLGGYLPNIEAGVRARSNISPFMVAKDGEVILVLGAAGGAQIPPAVVHAVTRVIDFGMPLPEALAEPRVSFSRAGGYNAETSPGIGWTDQELAEMRALGITINETPRSGSFGRVHGIQYVPERRTWIGGADPDWEGSARGPARR